MDFFARQERARAQTRRLVVLFGLSVLGVVLTLTFVMAVVLAGSSLESGGFDDPAAWALRNAPMLLGCAGLVLAIVMGGAALKSAQLEGGGAVVAKNMGGERVSAGTGDPLKRRLLNVVEEMAIASGVPVPGVYVLEGERGINAFAAGHTAADAVVAVTRGALERFDRDELQGVIGHEFSHILNEDVRLNMRLIAMVAGLFAIAAVGRVLLRSRTRSRKGGGVVLIGLAMFVLGWIGVLFGRLIQAAVSRQREFLADASSVQFTRDPQGLRDALVKVGARADGSHLEAQGTADVAHMLFASGVSDLFATHPPLVERIRALDPSFEPGEFERAARRAPGREGGAPGAVRGAATAALAATAGASVPEPEHVAERVARPRPAHVRHAERLRVALPEDLVRTVAEPPGARAILAALLGGDGGGEPALAAAFGPGVAAAAAGRRPAVAELPANQRLPLLLQALPALGSLPLDDRRELLAAVDRHVRADGRITLEEYALARLARVHLGDQIGPAAGASRATLLQREPELRRVFATLARLGHADEAVARDACERGLTRALPGRPTPYEPPEDWVGAMDADLDRLDGLRPAEKQRFVDALATLVATDGRLELAEAEMLRAICGSVHCPLPPFLDEPGDA